MRIRFRAPKEELNKFIASYEQLDHSYVVDVLPELAKSQAVSNGKIPG